MISRRLFTAAAAAALGLVSLGSPAFAEPPTSLDLFIPAAPGGGWDQTGRALEQAMRADGLVSEFQFENVGGAGGTVGLPQFLSKKEGQANAMLVGGMVMMGAVVANKSPVKVTDTTPIARLTGEYEAVVVPADSELKTMGDLVAKLKADPGSVSWAGGSAGGTDHIVAGLIAKAAGVDPKTVAYVPFAGGGEALAAILGGQTTVGVSGYGEFAEQVKAGKLRVLGITAGEKVAGIDAPTMKEQGVDVVLANWRGVFAAPGITDEQKAELVALIEKTVAGPTWQKIAADKGWISIPLTGDEFGKFLADEETRITGILTDLGLAS